jgi:ABC-type transport system involved in multi-copper enzyme maturation permease subunit
MTDAALISPIRAGRLIGRGVALELLRRKDAYVLMLMMSVFLVGTTAVRIVGVEAPAAGTFLLNLGMTLAYYAAHLLTLLMSVRQMPDEIEHRTVYPLLAKPLDRTVLVVGKWMACAACGTAILAVLMLLGWLPAPRMESYHGGVCLQALLLLPVSLAMLSALGVCLSLMLPRGLAAVVAVGLFFGSHAVIGLAARAADAHPVAAVAAWCAHYLPDFTKLNLITRYTDGIGPLEPAAFGGLLLYGALCTALYLAVAAVLFRRRPL